MIIQSFKIMRTENGSWIGFLIIIIAFMFLIGVGSQNMFFGILLFLIIGAIGASIMYDNR